MATAPGTISSAGIGSGLDVSSIVSSLMQVERLPLNNLKTQATTMQTRLSAFGQIQSLASSFRDSATNLAKADSFAMTNAASSEALSVSASSTTKAIPGSYLVAVSALSSTQSNVSASGQFTAATDVVGSGTITLRLGTWSTGQTAFTPKTGSADVVIPVGASEGTLAGIRDKINAANAGVSATVVTDATGSRLALQSTATGAENGFRVSVTDDDSVNNDAAGLSRLAFDPPAPASANQLGLTQSAANTQATINGIAVSTAGNTLTDVVDGMTFNLGKVTTAPVTVTVSRNTDAVKSMLSGFVTAYNALNNLLTNVTAYNPASKQGALLQGDAAATGLQNQLRAMFGGPTGASSTFGTFSAIGLEFQKDGSLKLNDTKVAAALKNLPELTQALSNVDTATPANNGLAKKLALWADGLLAATGTLPGKAKSLQAQLASNSKNQAVASDRIDAVEKRIRAQYSALDKIMSDANGLSKYVQQQITTWNKSTA